MKPTKNRTYCNASGRVKMLFETESKADNFIRFNSKAFEDEGRHAPIRSYYCAFCNGWHITSNESEEYAGIFDARDRDMLESIKRLGKPGKVDDSPADERRERRRLERLAERDRLMAEKVNGNGKPVMELACEWTRRLSDIRQSLSFARIDEADSIIQDLEEDFREDDSDPDMAFLQKGHKIKMLEEYKRWLTTLKELLDMDTVTRHSVLDSMNGLKRPKYHGAIIRTIHNVEIREKLLERITEIESKAESGDTAHMYKDIIECESMIKMIRGAGKKYFTCDLKLRIFNLRKLIGEPEDGSIKSLMIQMITCCQSAKQALDGGDTTGCEEWLDEASTLYRALTVINEDTDLIRSVIYDLRADLDKLMNGNYIL